MTLKQWSLNERLVHARSRSRMWQQGVEKKKEKEYIATQKNGICTHTHYLKGGAFEGLPRRPSATGWEAKEREGKKETPPRSNNNGAFIIGYLFEVIYYFLVI